MTRFRISSLLIAAAAVSVIHAWEEGDEKKCPAKGAYDNTFYGFRMTIPKGLKGCPNSPTWSSDHGVMIALAGRKGSSWIECYAGFNALMYDTAEEAADAQVEFLEGEAIAGTVHVERRDAVTLAGMPAVRLLVQYTDSRLGEIVEDTTFVLRNVNEDSETPSHEYSVSLTTPKSKYAAQREILETVLASWSVPDAAAR